METSHRNTQAESQPKGPESSPKTPRAKENGRRIHKFPLRVIRPEQRGNGGNGGEEGPPPSKYVLIVVPFLDDE